MRVKIDRQLLNGTWIKYDDDISFELVPLNKSKLDFSKMSTDHGYFLEKVVECVVGWKGVVDERENELEFSNAYLFLLLGQFPAIAAFLIEKLSEIDQKVVKELKN